MTSPPAPCTHPRRVLWAVTITTALLYWLWSILVLATWAWTHDDVDFADWSE